MFTLNKKLIKIILIPIIISGFALIFIDYFLQELIANNCSLNILIAILSQRSNFIRRQTLRQTWIQTIERINRNNSLVKSNADNCRIKLSAKFIVADKDCPIHTIFRTDPYSCRLKNIEINSNNSENNLFEFNSNENNFVSYQTLFRGFSFVVS